MVSTGSYITEDKIDYLLSDPNFRNDYRLLQCKSKKKQLFPVQQENDCKRFYGKDQLERFLSCSPGDLDENKRSLDMLIGLVGTSREKKFL